MAAVGLVVLRRRSPVLLPTLASLATVVVVSLCFYGTARFRFPLDVMVTVLAGGAIELAIESRRAVAPAG